MLTCSRRSSVVAASGDHFARLERVSATAAAVLEPAEGPHTRDFDPIPDAGPPRTAAEPAPAPALPNEAPEGAWIVEAVELDEVRGFVWLGPEPPRLRLGADDRVDVVLDAIDAAPADARLASLPIAAALRGVAPSDGRLPAPLRALLRARARALWSTLAERFASDASWRERPGVGPALVDLLLRFPASDDASADEDAALLERLAHLRLFAVHDGSRISAAVALRERPAALEHLGLAARLAGLAGTPASPAPAPHRADAGAEPDATKDPDAWLIASLRAELSLVRGADDELLDDAALDALVLRNVTLESGGGRRPLLEHRRGLVIIDSAHPLVVDLRSDRDPTLLSLLTSAVYSFLNVVHERIEDHHEQRFAASHAAHVLSRHASG